MAELRVALVLVAAMAVASAMLAASPAHAQAQCGANIGQLMAMCHEYIQAPGPVKAPSKACCGQIHDVDVVCLCKSIPPGMEKTISMQKAVYVAKSCGKPIPSGTKCGSYTVPLV